MQKKEWNEDGFSKPPVTSSTSAAQTVGQLWSAVGQGRVRPHIGTSTECPAQTCGMACDAVRRASLDATLLQFLHHPSVAYVLRAMDRGDLNAFGFFSLKPFAISFQFFQAFLIPPLQGRDLG